MMKLQKMEPKGRSGMKKIPVQQLADALHLSRVTVWKVLNDRPGVAPDTVQRVREAVERLQSAPDDARELLPDLRPAQSVTLLAARADAAPFWMQIVDQIAADLSRRKIRLNYLPADVLNLSPGELASRIRREGADGVLVINIYERPLISALAAIPLPKVYLDAIPGLGAAGLRGDLLLLEGRGSVRALVRDLVQRGCRRIGFIGDIRHAQTNLLRWEGFRDGMKDAGLPVEPGICLTRSIDAGDCREAIAAFLDSMTAVPDGFVCVNDLVAFNTLNLLEERGVRVPGDVVLSGYDDSREFLLERRGVSTVRVQNAQLGRRMVSQLLYRMENPAADFEEIQVIPRVILRRANQGDG